MQQQIHGCIDAWKAVFGLCTLGCSKVQQRPEVQPDSVSLSDVQANYRHACAVTALMPNSHLAHSHWTGGDKCGNEKKAMWKALRMWRQLWGSAVHVRPLPAFTPKLFLVARSITQLRNESCICAVDASCDLSCCHSCCTTCVRVAPLPTSHAAT